MTKKAKNEELFKGMKHYAAWMPQDLLRDSSPSDIDFLQHNWNRLLTPFFFCEFKGSIEYWLSGEPKGQMGFLTDLAVMSWLVLVVEDRWSKLELKPGQISPDERLRYFIVPPIDNWTILRGEGRGVMTVSELHMLVELFMDGNSEVPEKFRWQPHWPKGRLKTL